MLQRYFRNEREAVRGIKPKQGAERRHKAPKELQNLYDQSDVGRREAWRNLAYVYLQFRLNTITSVDKN